MLTFTRTIEARAGGGHYPEDVSDELEKAVTEAAAATNGMVQVTLAGAPAAALVPLDLVEYALRHGWGR